MPSRRPKLEDVESDLSIGRTICSLCGVVIYDFSLATWSSDPLGVLEESEFQVYRQGARGPKHILVPSSKIENVGFLKFPWLANSYIRAVTLPSSSESDPRLTGITLYQENDETAPLYAPRDKNLARISGREKSIGGRGKSPRYNNLQFISFRPAELIDFFESEPIPPTDKRIAYLFHAHCWEVLCHIQGRETIEKRLPDLLQAVKQFWNGLCALPDDACEFPRGYRWGIFDPDIDFQVRLIDKVLYAKYDKYTYGCDIYISPWVVPEVHAAIASSRAPGQKKAYKNQCPSILPLECWLIILNFLCPLQYTRSDVQNLRNLLSVLALDVPDSFWKKRLQIHGDILLELDTLRDDDDGSLDWSCLCLNLLDLLFDESWFISSGLATRKRALRFIRGITRQFEQCS